MADAIKLPPLPEPPAWMDDEGDVFARPETPEMALSLPTMLYTTDQLRARDLEVARLVLEAAAQTCKQKAGRMRNMRDYAGGNALDHAALLINELQVRHHE